MTGAQSADALRVEATGETVGEAKWAALRELEKLYPELDKAAVRFQVVSEGERGLLGVGYVPAYVIATVEPETGAAAPAGAMDDSELAAVVREVAEYVIRSLDSRCRVQVTESDDSVTVLCSGPSLGRVIGKHGQTIDAIQYLVNAIVARGEYGERKAIVVDAAGYRSRRETTLLSLAQRSAEEVRMSGRAVELEPMSSVERKIVHESLKEFPGVHTASEGFEPNRYVVVLPAGDAARPGSGPAEEAPGEPGDSPAA